MFANAFQGVEVTAELVKEFLNSPIGFLTVSIAVWEIAGKDMLALILGITCVIIALCMLGSSLKKVFTPTTILKSKEGKLKTYATVNPLYQEDEDAAGVYLTIRIIMIIFLCIMGCIGIGIGLG